MSAASRRASPPLDLSTPSVPHQKSHSNADCILLRSPPPSPAPSHRITISNFRSFRQQPEIHPFSPATNAVVGRNGSGKSNLFDAVQFCLLLSPRFHTLRTVRLCPECACCAVLCLVGAQLPCALPQAKAHPRGTRILVRRRYLRGGDRTHAMWCVEGGSVQFCAVVHSSAAYLAHVSLG